MISFFKTKAKTSIRNILTFAFLLSAFSTVVTVLSNFSNSYLPEAISNDISHQYNKTGERVEMDIALNNFSSVSWFKNNDSAVQEMGTIHRNDSVFMRYDPISVNRIRKYEDISFYTENENVVDSDISINLYGNANTRLGVTPYLFKTVAGTYKNDDYIVNKDPEYLKQPQNIVLSRSLADLFIEYTYGDTYDSLIGQTFIDEQTGNQFIIRCIVENKCLMNDEETAYFIYSGIVTFSAIYSGETLVFLFSNNKYTNYSLILYTLYYIYKPTTTKTFTLTFPGNEWIENQFHYLFSSYTLNNKVLILNFMLTVILPIAASFLYLTIRKNDDISALELIFISFGYLLIKSLLNVLFNCIVISNLAINMFIGVGYLYEVFMLLIFIACILIFKKKTNTKTSAEKVNNYNEYYCIKI